VTIAIQPLDPIAAAEAEIAGSKSLMAAVADDLSQHERWLAHYQLAEKRHARWVMLQELIYRTELALQRLMRFSRRVSLLALRLARRVAAFTASTAVFVYTSIRDAVIACLDWLRPRALALALLLRRWLVASSVWLAAQARALAALLARWSSAAWAWTRVHAAIAWSWVMASWRAIAAAVLSWLVRTGRRAKALARILWRNSLYAGSVTSAWTAATGRAVAISLRQKLSAASKWTAVNGRILARASAKNARRASIWGAAQSRAAAASIGRNASRGAAWSAATAKEAARASIAASRESYSWVMLRMRAVSNATFGATAPNIAHTGRALIVRRSTALICFEPKRPGFPSPHAS
jgi:hypothetical protein